MKNLLIAATLLIASQAMGACPQLRGEYKQCKYTKAYQFGEDDTAGANEYMDVLGISIAEDLNFSPKMYKITDELPDDVFHGEEEGDMINPFEVVVVGETRKLTMEDPAGKTTFDFTASCVDNNLRFDINYHEDRDDYGEGPAKGTSVLLMSKKGKTLTRENIQTNSDTGEVEVHTILECTQE